MSAPQYEKSDLSFSIVLKFFSGLVAVLLIVSAICLAVIHFYPEIGAPTRAAIPPQPRLQSDPAADMRAMRREEEMKLDHYAWVDRDKGTVRIPIEQAMKILLERGLPTRKTS